MFFRLCFITAPFPSFPPVRVRPTVSGLKDTCTVFLPSHQIKSLLHSIPPFLLLSSLQSSMGFLMKISLTSIEIGLFLKKHFYIRNEEQKNSVQFNTFYSSYSISKFINLSLIFHIYHNSFIVKFYRHSKMFFILRQGKRR